MTNIGTDHKSGHQDYVEMFLRGVGHNIPDKPEIASRDLLLMQGRLLLEEAFEYLEAAGVEVYTKTYDDDYAPSKRVLYFEEIIFEQHPTKEPDIVKIADGLGDVMVIATGGLSFCGIPDRPILNEIDSNNLSKLREGHIDPDTGKFIKPENHKGPDLERVLIEHGWVTSNENV